MGLPRIRKVKPRSPDKKCILEPNFYSKPTGIYEIIYIARGKDSNKHLGRNSRESYTSCVFFFFLFYPSEYRKGTESQHVVCVTTVIPQLDKQSIYPLMLSKDEILNEEK